MNKILYILPILFLLVMAVDSFAYAYGPQIPIDNPTPFDNDQFGFSVTSQGNYILIGSAEDNTGATSAGSAYLLDATTGELLQTFNNPDPADFDIFGYSVAMSGDNVLVGAPFDDPEDFESGSAYLFDANSGALLQTFQSPNPSAGESFGISVSISGNNILIGSNPIDLGEVFPDPNPGAAYLFDATTGDLLRTFNPPLPSGWDRFGEAVSISGDNVLIGSGGYDNAEESEGVAYLFDATTGDLLQTFHNPTPQPFDGFGFSVSMDGNNVLIGTLSDNVDTGSEFFVDAGSAYLFDATSGQLLHTFNNPTPLNYEHFGISVSILGNNVLVGSWPLETPLTPINSGSAHLFDATTGDLLQSFYHPISDDWYAFGASVSVSDNGILVGSPFDNAGAPRSGSAYFYPPSPPQIIIEKQTIPDGSTDLFSFSSSTGELFDLTDNETHNFAVFPGVYDVSEIISDPIWILADIQCDDNDSVADVVAQTVEVSVSENEAVTCTFTNSNDLDGDGLTNDVDPDDDGDGIDDVIDTQPTVPSTEFSDGTTSGEILSGKARVTVGADGKIEIKSVGDGPVTVKSMDLARLKVVGDVTLKRGSLSIEVLSGTAEVEFLNADEVIGTTTLVAGDNVTFDEQLLQLTNNGSETVILYVDGEETILNQGETVTIYPSAIFEGCGAGYWKNPDHFDEWPEGVNPNDPFSLVFVFSQGFFSEPPIPSYLDVLEMRGGSPLDKLGKEILVASLNLVHPEIYYGLDENQLNAIISTALSNNDSEEILDGKNQLEHFNNMICPIN